MLSRLFVGLFALLLASAGQANAPRTFSEAIPLGTALADERSECPYSA
ncbi:hypothetical protein ACLBUQ_33505, partial [Pseudomonas aeruginosa]